jgi:hypothetical protein
MTKKTAGRGKLFSVVPIIGLTVLIGYYLFEVLPKGELGQGEKWRVLQELEATHRKDATAGEPILSRASPELSYAAVGVPTGDKKSPYVWVLLDDTDDSYEPIKMIPKGIPVVVECSYVSKIAAEIRVATSTLAFLKASCRPNPPR